MDQNEVTPQVTRNALKYKTMSRKICLLPKGHIYLELLHLPHCICGQSQTVVTVFF